MRRADRLFQVIQLLRRHRVVTARDLAERLEVSERTIYRDVQDLMRSGVPIEGEAGVGYMLRRGFDLPPLMFTESEVTALVLGMRVASSWADPALAKAATAALERVEAALPERLKTRLQETRLFAPNFHVPTDLLRRLGDFREALEGRRKLWLEYRDAKNEDTTRTVRPLGLFFWAPTWSLTAWCELRGDFRAFRLDRVQSFEVLPERFEEEPGRTLDDFFRQVHDHEEE